MNQLGHAVVFFINIHTPEVQGGILFTTQKPTQMITSIITFGQVPQQKETYNKLKLESIEKQRFAFFSGKLYQWVQETRAESDTHVYWAINSCTPKWNIKSGLYLKKDAAAGCSYDKVKKTFKWWYGKQAVIACPTLVADMCNYFKTEWFLNIPPSLKVSCTNTNLNKVLLGKITNPRDLIKGILKTNPVMRGMNISTETLWKYVNARGIANRLQSLSDIMSVAKDPNHALEFMATAEYLSLEVTDLIKQAQMLNRKIDFKWSKSRMSEVHSDWTAEIMDIEQESVERIDYQYVNELPTNGSLQLITNSKDLYIEGKTMSHCVFTNYASQVKDKSYFVFKFVDRDVRATLGISKYYDHNGFVINQMYGKRNATIDDCHHEYVKDWLAKPEVQQWFKDNYRTNRLPEPEPELVHIF
jgi:hypothetical protein